MAGCARKSEDAAKHRTEQTAWAKQVIDDKAKVAKVLRTGYPPRQLLSAQLAAGETLDADVVVSSTVKLRDAAGASPEMTRTTLIRARIRLRAVQPVADGPPIALDIVELSGGLRDLEKLSRGALIESGAHGEPWMCVLREPGGGAAIGLDVQQRWLWERDVCGWARGVLMPVPLEPLGVGAAWRRQWTDYFSYDKVTELHDYVVTAVTNGIVQIQATATSDTDAAGSSGHAKATATIALPLGRRAVPTATWTTHGTATITEHGRATEMATTATTRIYPHAP